MKGRCIIHLAYALDIYSNVTPDGGTALAVYPVAPALVVAVVSAHRTTRMKLIDG